MAASLVRILDGNTFVVSDDRGDIEASTTDPTGLFSYDMRFLSTWVLTINDIRLNALSTDDLQYFEARFFLVPATGTVYIDPKLSVIRQRAVGLGFHEELTILSHSAEPAELDDPDRGRRRTSPTCSRSRTRSRSWARTTPRSTASRWSSATSARRSGARRRSRPPRPPTVDEHGLTFTVTVEPHGTWTTDLNVVTSLGGLGRRVDRDEVRPDEPQGAARHGPEPRGRGSTRRRTSSATGSRSRRPTTAASSTSRPCGSRR